MGGRSSYGKKAQERRAASLAGFGLFQGLATGEARKVARWMEEKRFLRGETIYRRDDPVDSIYALEEGLVKIVSCSEKGTGTIVYIVRPPEIFGELLLSEEKRPFHALAVTDVLAGILSREHFVELLSSVPRVRLNFIRILSRRLVHVEKTAAEFRHARSNRRLARTLLRMCVEHGEDAPGGVLLRVSLTHADLADMIGTTRETVTNQLNRFHRLGIVIARNRHLVVNRRRLDDFLRSKDVRRLRVL